MEKLRIVVGGFIGLYPSGGVTWDYIQYVLGLRALGHDVYYIEDTGQYSNYRITEKAWDDPFDSVEYLRKIMADFSLSENWAYRDTFSGLCYGLPFTRIIEICSKADVFINISDANIYRDEYGKISKRVLIDSDPMFTQLQVNETLRQDERYPVKKFSIYEYNYHFTFGENFGAMDCRIPKLGLQWTSTRQPICLSYWKERFPHKKIIAPSFTTVMNWSTRTKLNYQNEEWGQKDVEFKRYISIPKRLRNANFKIVMAASAAFKEDIDYLLLTGFGWNVLNPLDTVKTLNDYQKFIATSDAEFSVAKETYVKSNSGWFSCRSACYLAMGKPVVTQDTQWSKFIPSGLGLFGFKDIETAVEALKQVASNLEKHSKAAREIADAYFDSNKVLSKLLSAL